MSDETVDFRCDCGRVYHASVEHVGKHIKCSNCGRLVEVKAGIQAKVGKNDRALKVESPAGWAKRHLTVSIKMNRSSCWGWLGALALLTILVGGVYLARKTSNAVTSSGRPATSGTQSTEAASSPMSVADSSADTSSTVSNCPREPIALANGARLEPDVGLTGEGTLTVDNGTSDDATVELVNINTDESSRYAYIQAHRKLTLKGIEAGAYHLMFSSGTNWAGDDFTCSPSYSEFEKELVYAESVVGNRHRFHEMSVTLHTVPQGNVEIKTISRADFRHRLHALSR